MCVLGRKSAFVPSDHALTFLPRHVVPQRASPIRWNPLRRSRFGGKRGGMICDAVRLRDCGHPRQVRATAPDLGQRHAITFCVPADRDDALLAGHKSKPRITWRFLCIPGRASLPPPSTNCLFLPRLAWVAAGLRERCKLGSLCCRSQQGISIGITAFCGAQPDPCKVMGTPPTFVRVKTSALVSWFSYQRTGLSSRHVPGG